MTTFTLGPLLGPSRQVGSEHHGEVRDIGVGTLAARCRRHSGAAVVTLSLPWCCCAKDTARLPPLAGRMVW